MVLELVRHIYSPALYKMIVKSIHTRYLRSKRILATYGLFLGVYALT